MRQVFYRRWLRKIFHSPSWADAISSTSGLALGAVGHFWPKSVVVEHSWQIPILGFAAIGIVRFIAAPYELWKEEMDRADQAETALADAVNPDREFDEAFAHFSTRRVEHVHRIDPIGEFLRDATGRLHQPSLQQQFDDAILALRHVVNAREIWWATLHSRNGPSPLGTKLIDAIDGVRRCFPPGANGDLNEDQISRLHRASSNFGYALGGSTTDSDRVKARRRDFDDEIEATIKRFRELEN